MEATQELTAKRQMLLLMQAGVCWQEAANHAGIQTSRSTAYRWLAAFRTRGDDALHDGRHGHPAKVREPVLKLLEERCRSHPQMASASLQAELQERFGVTICITHLNRVRATSGLSRQADRVKKRGAQRQEREAEWWEGAGGLVLLAAAHETGLLASLETTLASSFSSTLSVPSRLLTQSQRSCHSLIQTLLFLGVVGLRRTWDLRGYTGEALGLLSGRHRAYSYFYVERFLCEVAHTSAAQDLTDALARWSTQLWQPPVPQNIHQPAPFYVDGHRKPVYTDGLIPL